MPRQEIPRWPAVDSVNGTRSLLHALPYYGTDSGQKSDSEVELAGLGMRNAPVFTGTDQLPDCRLEPLPPWYCFRVARYSSTKVVLFPLLAPNLASKICLDFCPACMSRPIGWRSSPENVLQVQSCTAFDEEPDYFIMAAPGSLVQRCRVGMPSHRVVSVWIFARVKQQSNDLDRTKIRCQSESQMAVLTAGARQQPTGILDAPQRRCHRQIDSSATPDQGVHCLELAVQGRRLYCAVGIRCVIAQEID
jgi:hypothetical protein